MDIKENTTWIKNLNVIFTAEDSPLNIYDNSTTQLNTRELQLYLHPAYTAI